MSKDFIYRVENLLDFSRSSRGAGTCAAAVTGRYKKLERLELELEL